LDTDRHKTRTHWQAQDAEHRTQTQDTDTRHRHQDIMMHTRHSLKLKMDAHTHRDTTMDRLGKKTDSDGLEDKGKEPRSNVRLNMKNFVGPSPRLGFRVHGRRPGPTGTLRVHRIATTSASGGLAR